MRASNCTSLRYLAMTHQNGMNIPRVQRHDHSLIVKPEIHMICAVGSVIDERCDAGVLGLGC